MPTTVRRAWDGTLPHPVSRDDLEELVHAIEQAREGKRTEPQGDHRRSGRALPGAFVRQCSMSLVRVPCVV